MGPDLYGPDSGPGGVLTGAGVKLAPGSASVTAGEDASYSSVGVTGGLEGVVTAVKSKSSTAPG